MWGQAAAVVIGVWLYAAPSLLDYEGAAAIDDRIAGSLVITFAFVAIWEFMRGLRLAYRPIAAWLLVAPWILGAPWAVVASDMACGAALVALSFVEGEVEGRYAGGWSALWRG